MTTGRGARERIRRIEAILDRIQYFAKERQTYCCSLSSENWSALHTRRVVYMGIGLTRKTSVHDISEFDAKEDETEKPTSDLSTDCVEQKESSQFPLIRNGHGGTRSSGYPSSLSDRICKQLFYPSARRSRMGRDSELASKQYNLIHEN